MKKVSVIIVAYKHADVLLNCLNSIVEYNDLGDELEVIIVDNSPVDERVENDISESRYTDYKYIAADNRGFGAGNNIGAKIAQGEVLAFLNPDTILIEPIFKRIYNRFEKNANLNLFGIKLLGKEKNKVNSLCIQPDSSYFLKKIIWWFSYFNKRYTTVAGSAMFVRKSAFEEVGMFDENIFMYYEELDLTNRLEARFPNEVICFERNMNIIHLESECIGNLSNEHLIQLHKALIYYCKKYNLNYKKIIKHKYRICKFKARLGYKFNYNNRIAIFFEKYYSDIVGK